MATGHFPTESHKFAWNGHVNIDGMTTVTLQTKYDPTLPSGYPKIAYPVEMSSGSGIYSDAVSHLPATEPPTAKRPADHVNVVYRDVIAGSRESRGHHYDAPFIYRILKSLLPQNNAFFIATASVVKDALDTTDCERLREQWYYLRFYVRRTMPPTESNLRQFRSSSPCFFRWFINTRFVFSTERHRRHANFITINWKIF